MKTRTPRRFNVGSDATKSLSRVLEDLPSSIRFCAEQLISRGSVIGVHVAKLLDSGFDLERHVLLIHDDEAWDDRILERVNDKLAAAPAVTGAPDPTEGAEAVETTEATIVRSPQLREQIGRAFEAAAADVKRVGARHDEARDLPGA